MKMQPVHNQETKSQAAAEPVAQKQDGANATFQFEDRRAEAVAQRQLQAMMKGGPQTQQVAAMQQAAADNTVGRNGVQLHPAIGHGSAESVNASTPIQRKVGFEYELAGINPKQNANWLPFFAPTWQQLNKGYVIRQKAGYEITADLAANGGNNLEFVTRPFDEAVPTELAAVTAVANSIVADIAQITQHQPPTDIRSSTLGRIQGPRSVYFDVRDADPIGQIQMTGGVALSDLADIMSGESLGDIPPGRVSVAESYKAMPLQKYYRSGLDGLAMPVIFAPALAAVNRHFHLRLDRRRMVASVVALMAQMVITHRQERFGAGSDNAGRFIAKTDYAEILQQMQDEFGFEADWRMLLTCILEVANRFVDAHVSGNSPVFPPEYNVGGTRFPHVTIREWVNAAIPKGRAPEYRSEMIDTGFGPVFMDIPTGRDAPIGKDKMTKTNYPGSKRQRDELGAFGTYGSKKDPGNKVIMEWRDLKSLFKASQLTPYMEALFTYYRNI